MNDGPRTRTDTVQVCFLPPQKPNNTELRGARRIGPVDGPPRDSLKSEKQRRTRIIIRRLRAYSYREHTTTELISMIT